MNLSTYYTPTKIVFGKGAEEQVGALIRERGCRKVLLHYGGGSARRSGLLDRVERSLEEAGVSYVSLGGVVPNPRLSLVYLKEISQIPDDVIRTVSAEVIGYK